MFESGVALTMVPLEVTHTALVTTGVLQRLRTADPTPFRELIVQMLMYFSTTYSVRSCIHRTDIDTSCH